MHQSYSWLQGDSAGCIRPKKREFLKKNLSVKVVLPPLLFFHTVKKKIKLFMAKKNILMIDSKEEQ